MKIHYSELDLYLQCPFAYKKRYIDGIKDEEESSALHLGTALHAAIRNHFEGGDAEEAFLIYWDSLRETPMIYYRHGWQELRDIGIRWIGLFIKMHAKRFTDFKMEELLEAPLFIDGVHDNGLISIEGTFDMCGMYENVFTLTDWKTSSKEYPKSKINKNPQMYLYAHMYKHRYGRLPDQIQYKVFRKDNGGIQTIKKEITKENLALQLANTRDIVKMMLHSRANNLWPHTFNCYCKENE